MEHAKIGLVVCSQRTPRAGLQISHFVQSTIHQTSPRANIHLIDLAEWNLPLYNEPGIPSQIRSPADDYVHDHTRTWSREIASFAAFIFVTPQYNWGYPASLKNAIDYLYHEWAGKPAMIVSYGGHGGGKAAAQLREVLQGVRMKPLEEMVALTFPSKQLLGSATRGEDLGLHGGACFWEKERFQIQDIFGKLEMVLQDDVEVN
ncbi:hypothetical protein ARAM_001223 [Aspergillus rambellii]|uniref:NADPH-dependent FMN reductase-like domain-containing protein n=1 Tax=Aspergillus rambellii TaxID=308745 RepID=A0A0F8V543_9EURO|nr:hypothetical protein ARAM_001223 [Aspergillus rambellii]